MDLKVIEPIKTYDKVFSSPVEFNLWYAKHKEEVNALTTHKLNKLYHIEGYRITKIKGELMLKADNHKGEDDEENIKKEIKKLKNEISKIYEEMNKIIGYIDERIPPQTTQ